MTAKATTAYMGFALWWADEQRLYICISIGLLVHGLGRRALIPTTTQSPKTVSRHYSVTLRNYSTGKMRQPHIEEIIKFLTDNVEPFQDNAYGFGYRAAVYLKDGTYLPCVIFRSSATIVKLAIRRFKEEKKGNGIFNQASGIGYYNIVKSFVTNGNRINVYDIERVEKSKYAFPLAIQKQITGETTMGWTGFAAKMKDGKIFGFGTTFTFEFFSMPEGYIVEDIVEIINHSYVLKSGELRSHRQGPLTRPEEYQDAVVYRERPSFDCFIDNL